MPGATRTKEVPPDMDATAAAPPSPNTASIDATPSQADAMSRVPSMTSFVDEPKPEGSVTVLAPLKEEPVEHTGLYLSTAVAMLALSAAAASDVSTLVRLFEENVQLPKTIALTLGGDSMQVHFVPPNLSLLLELGVFASLSFAIACTHTAMLLAGRGNAASGALSVVLGALALPLPFLLESSYGLPKMGCALMLWVSYWKVLDIVGGTARPAVVASPRTLLLHLLILVEYRGDQHSNEVAPPSELPATIRKVMLVLAGYMALASAHAHEPPEALVAAAPSLLYAIRVYAAVWIIYVCLMITGEGNALVLNSFGLRPQTFFRNPMFASQSPVDFWSRRWNLLIRGLFHRSIFSPLRARKTPTGLCALAAFVVSGLFHEYAFMAASGGRAFGSNLLFFLTQGIICTLETVLTALGVRAPRWVREAPKLRAALTTLCCVPFSPLFMAPLRVHEVGETNVLQQMLSAVPHFRVELLG